MAEESGTTTGGKTILTEARAREVVEVFVVCPGRGKRTLHLPGATTDQDEPAPACHKRCGNAWKTREVELFPPGYYPICRDCRKTMIEPVDE